MNDYVPSYQEVTVPPRGRRRAPTLLKLLMAAVGLSAAGIIIGLIGHWLVPDELKICRPVAVVLIVLRHLSAFGDSWRPMLAALSAAITGAHGGIYTTVFFDASTSSGVGFTKFQYPLSSLFPIAIVQYVSGSRTIEALNVINIAVYFLNLFVVFKIGQFLLRQFEAGGEYSGEHMLPLCLALVCAVCFFPVNVALRVGQIQLWIDLLFSLACLFWLHGRTGAAGVMVGLICVIKPQLALLLVWSLLRREWRFSAGIVGVLLPINLLSLYQFGFTANLQYLDVLSFLARHGESYYSNNSINGVLHRLLHEGPNVMLTDGSVHHLLNSQMPPANKVVEAATVVSSILLYMAAALVGFSQRKRRPLVLEFGFVAMIATMASPIAWNHHYGIILPLFLIYAFELVNASSRPPMQLFFLATAWFFCANDLRILNLTAETWANPLQAHVFIGALIFLCLLGSRLLGNKHAWRTLTVPGRNSRQVTEAG
jgi:hypothetical protein